MPIEVYDSSGLVVFNSRDVKGGVVAGTYLVTSSATTLTYPEFAGYTAFVVVHTSSVIPHGITTDTTLGYPRVIVPAGGTRRFSVMMT